VFVFGVLIGILLFYAKLVYYQDGAIIAEGITRKGILAIRIGMTPVEVVNLIGYPVCIKYARKNISRATSSSLASDIDSDKLGSYTWIYARPSNLSIGGFEMNVYFNSNKLEYAYIENYDLGVYKCNVNKCPTIYSEREIDEMELLRINAFHNL
jgi:hypothetical protein